ncbi:MAG: hypothetical protein DYH12_34220 [Sorangiineae bacterium PRO1]|nr:hypothetical protein [Sorangiineae bacterium PRO1]
MCDDGLDNDLNGQVDCADAACTAACASACAAPTVLADPSSTQGDTASHKDSLKASCSESTSGPDLAYEVTAAKTGVFEAILGGFSNLTLSLRSSCTGAELACTKGKVAKIPVTAGTKLWVIVDGAGASDVGPFGLSVQSRPIACGDKHTDGTEECDDGNKTNGDGCSATCTIEYTETEPNNTVAQASTWSSPYAAAIGTVGDVDVVKVSVTQAGGTLSATVTDFGDNACDQDKIDSYMELWDQNDNAIGSDNDSGDGLCSQLSKTNLAVGTYYLVISAAPGANPATFSYKLNVSLN